MATNATVPNKITFYPDQLRSLLFLARVLPARKHLVILALLHYLQGDSLKSTATREQIEEFTGLKKRTIYTFIKEFEKCGLIKQWRGPFDLKQKFYRVNLPVSDSVFEFYGMTTQTVSRPKEQVIPDGSNRSKSLVQVNLSTAPDTGVTPQAATSASDTPSIAAETHPDPSDITDASESFFGDPRLDLLVRQVEEGRKNGTRLFRWLKSQDLLLYWPPTDGYRVEKELLGKKVKSVEDLNAILAAPVRPEYQWFVAGFLQCCRDNGYEAEDTSKAHAFDINILLDSMLRAGYGGRAEWTAESIKAQLKHIIEEWPRLKTWQARLTVEPPSVPTLEFLVMDKAIWQAAKEKLISRNEAELSALFDRLETGR
jgi:hypothetical protein